jgi:hypothetical protein
MAQARLRLNLLKIDGPEIRGALDRLRIAVLR